LTLHINRLLLMRDRRTFLRLFLLINVVSPSPFTMPIDALEENIIILV